MLSNDTTCPFAGTGNGPNSFIVHPNRLLHGKLSITTPRESFSVRAEMRLWAAIFPNSSPVPRIL